MPWQSQLVTVLLPAILAVESGGRTDVPDSVAGARPCQITVSAWRAAEKEVWDCTLGTYRLPCWADGAKNAATARIAAQYYLLRLGQAYQDRTGKPPTLAILARMYNGGPRGYQNRSTWPYWLRVKAAMEKAR